MTLAEAGPDNSCMRARVVRVVVFVLAGLSAAAGASAQSLADVARREEARRKTIKAPARVYTNDDLRNEAPPSPPVTSRTPATAPGSSAEVAAPAAEAAPDSDDTPVRDEKYWRGRIDAARTALSRAETFADALQSRINALATDFVNRDDPAQRNQIAADRQKALSELDRVKQEIAAHQKEIAAIQEEARRANVPAGWVR